MSVFGRDSLQETIYHADPTEFLGRAWEIMVGTIEGKIYQLGASLSFSANKAEKEMSELIRNIYERFEMFLGTPTEETRGNIIWDTETGKVIFQYAVLKETKLLRQIYLLATEAINVMEILNSRPTLIQSTFVHASAQGTHVRSPNFRPTTRRPSKSSSAASTARKLLPPIPSRTIPSSNANALSTRPAANSRSWTRISWFHWNMGCRPPGAWAWASTACA